MKRSSNKTTYPERFFFLTVTLIRESVFVVLSSKGGLGDVLACGKGISLTKFGEVMGWFLVN